MSVRKAERQTVGAEGQSVVRMGGRTVALTRMYKRWYIDIVHAQLGRRLDIHRVGWWSNDHHPFVHYLHTTILLLDTIDVQQEVEVRHALRGVISEECGHLSIRAVEMLCPW